MKYKERRLSSGVNALAKRYTVAWAPSIALCGLFLTTFSATCSVQAQSTIPASDTGVHDYQTYDGEHENVSLGSGNVFVSIPLLTLPGRKGMNYSVGLNFNSQSWSFNGGWTNLNIGMVATHTSEVSFHPGGSFLLSTNPDIRCIGYYTSTDENGGIHSFSNVQTGCYSCSQYVGCQAETGYDTLGGSDDRGEGITIDLNPVGTQNDPTACRLTEKDGTWFPLSSCSSTSSVGGAASITSPITMEDANGNRITSAAGGGGTGSFAGGGNGFPSGTDYDTVHRSITYTNSPFTIQYKDPNAPNGTFTVTLNVQSLQLSCPLTASNGASVPTVTVNVITSALLPNGLTYIFQYDGCGTLTKIVYPSGGIPDTCPTTPTTRTSSLRRALRR
jgi:hypothetical protein